MTEAVALAIPAAPQYVALARLAAAEIALKSGFDEAAAEDVRLAVSEACTSILRHARGSGGLMRLQFRPDGDALAVEVHLPAERADLDGALSDAASEEERFGFATLEHLADDFEMIEAEGGDVVVRFTWRGLG